MNKYPSTQEKRLQPSTPPVPKAVDKPDPEGYMARKGWGHIIFTEVESTEALQSLYESLQAQIIEILAALDAFRDTPQHELHRTLKAKPELFDITVKKYLESLTTEIQELEVALIDLETELQKLLGNT